MSPISHQGHRKRMKERFAQEGLDHFSDIQVLELLLFYCNPRQDTNPIAHALLDHFGSLAQVLEAPVEELQKVSGVGQNAALFLHLITEVGRYYLVNRVSQCRILSTVEECAEYLLPFFYGRRVETVFLLCLDAKGQLIREKKLSDGCVNMALISPREISLEALKDKAVNIILVHNHPSGDPTPSRADRELTDNVAGAGEQMDIPLLDHIIIGDNRYTSFKEQKLLR